jgi:capsular exopolysaccharide synthesis family protein
MFSSLDKPLDSFLVTSAGPGEGKSLTTANLGVAFAQYGKDVIIVDADLRKPTQHRIFGIDNSLGLTSVMLGELSIQEALHRIEETRLSVMTTGPLPPNPAELLGSERMKEIIEELKAKADIVIFDTPPVVAVTDAALLASRMDGVLLVLAAGKVKIEVAQKAQELLLNVRAHLLGTVLNMMDQNNPDYYYYNNYYYSDDHEKKRRKRSR